MDIIEINKEQIKVLCEMYNVRTLHIFGSVLSGKLEGNSDIDFLVDFNKMPVEDYADTYFNLKFALIDIFKRNIDLLEFNALKNPLFLEEVNKNKVLIYGKPN